MADIQANIGVNIEAQQALAQLKALQKQISAFHSSMAKSGAAAQAATAGMQQSLIDTINATGKFSAQLTSVKTTTESFTNALEKNKLSFGQYFRYAGASTKTFGRMFKTEVETINKVARERVKDLQTQYIKMGRDANGAMKAIAVRPLALDMNNLGTQTAIAAQKQQIFNQLLRQGSTNLLNFGKNVQWSGRQLMVGFTLPLTILGTTAGRVFMEMEKQAISFRKVYGDLFTPNAEREKALKDIQELGMEFTKYGIAVSETIKLASDAAAAGFAGTDLQAQTTQATRLSVLGQLDQQKALETTISLQNAFKLSNEELAQSIDFLNAVENQTVISLDDVTTAIPKVAPVIKSLGGDVEDLAFFLAAMKEGGVNASEGANALKSGLARIINPTRQATEFMASLGINIKGIVEQNAGDLMGTMMTLGRALDELDPLNRARAIEQLFGRFQFARISTLFDNITKEGTQAQRVAALATSTVEELAALSEGELAVVSESTTARFESAFEQLRASLAPIGKEFMELAIPFLEFGKNVLDSFNNLEGGTKRIIMGIVGVIGGLGPIAIMTFGLLANGVANILKTFGMLLNVFNKTRQNTNLLGGQFDYLTQEQLQAQAVAASLDQIHNKLIQTFTSEARHVDRLRAAYEKAVVAQSRFRGPAAGPAPKGYASGGIVSGPGTGTSDSIAAMVSDGEAIIPAEMVKKYGALVNGIIADEIPGFAKGRGVDTNTNIVASHFDIFSPENLGSTIKNLGDAIDGVTAEMWNLEKSADGASLEVTKTAGELKALVDENKLLFAGGRAYGGTAIADPGPRNAMFNAVGISGEAFDASSLIEQSDLVAQIDKNSDLYRAHSVEIERLIGEGQQLREAMDATGDAYRVNYEYMRQNSKTAIEQSLMQKRGMTVEKASIEAEQRMVAIDREYETLRRSGISQEKAYQQAREKVILTTLQAGSLNGQFVQAGPGVGSDTTRAVATGRTPRNVNVVRKGSAEGNLWPTGGQTAKFVVERYGARIKESGQRIVETIAKLTAQGMDEAAQAKSPARKTKKAAKNLVDGVVVGVTEGADEAKVAGGKLGTAVIDGVSDGGGTSGGGRRTPGIPGSGVASEGLERFNRGLMAGSFALSSISSVAMFAGGETGKMAENIAKVTGVMFAFSGAVELATMALRSQALQSAFGGGGGGMVGKGFRVGVRAAKAGGATGVAGKLLGGLRGIVSIIPKFALGLTGVVGVLGILAAGGWMLYKAYQKQKESIEGLGNVANMSAEKMQKLGDVFGVAVKTGGLSRGFAPSMQGVDAETQTAAASYVGTEEFRADYSKEIEALKNGVAADVELALRTLAGRLEASGFAQDQVQAIVNAMVQESGRTDLNLDFANIGISNEKARQAIVKSLEDASKKVTSLPLPNISSVSTMPGSTVAIAGQQVSSTGTLPGSTIDIAGQSLSRAGTNATAAASPERLQAIDQYASSLTGTFEALGLGVEQGIITVDEFNSTMDQVLADFDSLNETDKQAVFDKLLESLPEGSDQFKELLGNVDDLDAKFALIRAKSTGLISDDALAGFADEFEKSAAAGEDNASIIARINSLLGEQITLTEEKTAAEIAAAEVTAARESMDKTREDLENEIAAYDMLMAAGFSAADAIDATANAEFNRAMVSAANAGERAALIADYREIADLQGVVTGRREAVRARSGGGGGQKDTSSIDKLTKDVRNLVNANTQITEGFDASSRSLDDLINSGTNGFNGLEQQIRNLGGSKDLIELIAGMPPEEFNKYKNRLFNFDPLTGTVTGLTEEAKKLGAALRAIALGNYINDQRQSVIDTKDQIKAMQKLRAAGLDYADALKVVQDQSVATAVASASTKSELRDIINLTKELAYYQRQMEEQSAKASAAESVKSSNKDYKDRARVIQKLASEQGKYNDAQIQAILDDPDLGKLYLDPKIDPKALNEALQNAKNQANLEVSIAVSTETGKEEYFNQMMGEINDAFAQQENKIQLQFDLDNKQNNQIVREAENAIAAIQYEIDDYQAQLKTIEDQEASINERYSERSKALDEVAKANERINRTQQAQLNIADALSRGDIAAAARAQQELRAQEAKDAEQTRREMLQKQQEAEIASVRSTSGQSREDIQNRIKELQDEVNNIEEKSLEPAQERLRLAEYTMQNQIDALEVSGKTRTEWDNIANMTAMAADNTETFATNVERALGLYEYFVNGVALDKGLFPDPVIFDTPEEKPKSSTTTPSSSVGSGGGGGGGGDSDTDPNAKQKQQLQQQINTLQSKMQPFVSNRNTTLTKISSLVTSLNAAKKSQNVRAIDYYETSLSSARATLAYLNRVIDSYSAQIAPLRSKLATLATGGIVKYKNLGGMIGMAAGGMFKSINTDTVPAMLTAGEYVIRKSAVQNFGVDNLDKINNGTYGGSSVYNYNLAVNVKSDADPNKIARTVMTSIKQIEGQRIRGNRL